MSYQSDRLQIFCVWYIALIWHAQSLIIFAKNKAKSKYTVNGLHLQANVANAVLTCTTFSYRNLIGWKAERLKERNKDTRWKLKRSCLQHWPNNVMPNDWLNLTSLRIWILYIYFFSFRIGTVGVKLVRFLTVVYWVHTFILNYEIQFLECRHRLEIGCIQFQTAPLLWRS